MDVDLGLELANYFDEYVSTSPVFISGETENMFILTAILKGYTRELMKIDVNDYGRSIVISGEKPVQDMVMVGWKVYKKEIKVVGFTKAFMIPDGVIMDQIKATFDKEKFKLSIAMPKMVIGIRGIRVKEVKEEELGIGDYRSLQVDDDDDHIQKIDLTSRELALVPEQGGEVHIKDEAENEIKQDNVPTIQTFDEKIADVQNYVISHNVLPLLENQMMENGLEETREKYSVEEHEAIGCDQHKKETVVYQGDGTDTTHTTQDDELTTKTEKTFRDQATQTDRPRRPKKCCCAPLIGGSALLVSILVFVIHLVRDQDKPKKKK